MDSTKLFTDFAVILLLAPCAAGQQNPRPLPWNEWADKIAYLHVINLTEYLIKDATYKLRHAEKIQEIHKHSITYELGTIAAGILDHFKRMLKSYRKYSDEDAFIRRDHTVWDYMYSFHYIQGAYNDIRMEQGMFYDIVRNYEATMATHFTLPRGYTLAPGKTFPPNFNVPPGYSLNPSMFPPPGNSRRFNIDHNNTGLKYIKQDIIPSAKSSRKPKQRKSTKKLLWRPSL